jgi:integrase
MAATITDKIARELTPPETGNRIIYDDKVKGFGLRVTAAGAKAFILRYRINGLERRLTIGAYGPQEWSVQAARKRAGELKRDVSSGIDPLAEKIEKRTAPTVADLCDRYIADVLPRKRASTQRDYSSRIRTVIRPALGKKKVADVRRTDIDRMHRRHAATPYQANRALAITSAMFSFAINQLEWRMDNPCRGIERFAEEKRVRYLSVDEIRRLTVALSDFPDVLADRAAKRRGMNVKPETVEKARRHGKAVADIIRLCLLTGCRRGEALNATWDQFNLETAEWIKPGSTTKQKTMHTAPLSDAAAALLRDMLADAPKGEDGKPATRYLFPGAKPEAPLVDIKKEWTMLRKVAELGDARLHDLRHTYASIIASAGGSLPLIGALLGHSNPVTTHRYAHLFSDPLRQAANTVGAIVTGEPGAEVVDIRKERG